MKTIIVDPDVIAREVAGESVILDLKTGRYLGLDEVGSRMWSVLLQSGSVELACEKLVEEYDVDPTRLRSDVLELVDKLVAHGLVMIQDDSLA